MVASLNIPLLVVHGEKDDIVPVDEAYRAQTLNPAKVRLAVIPQADHMFSLSEHQRQISQLAAGWFKDQQAGS